MTILKRINLSDGSTWFDADKADVFKANEEFNGSYFYDINTRDQWIHQSLYRTVSGKYILCEDNGRAQNTTYVFADEDVAYDWLARNGHESEIPKEEDEARNIDKGETPRRTVRISDDLWEKAQSTGNASKLITDLLTEHFSKR